MRRNYILTTAVLIASGALLLSNSTGPGGDLTNAPGSSGSCGSCHSGGSFSATPSINVAKKGTLIPVSEYEAGVTYTVAVTLTGGSSTTRGFQSTVLNSSNAKYGTIANPSTGSSVISANSRSIVQHTTPNSQGAWTYEWTAPSSASGSATIYMRGVVANGNSSDNGDEVYQTSKVLTLATAKTANAKPQIVAAYPNPSANVVNFSKELSKIEVYNIQGQQVLQKAVGKTLEISSLATGTYFVKAICNNENVVVKFNKI